jgi:hypothetical protein
MTSEVACAALGVSPIEQIIKVDERRRPYVLVDAADRENEGAVVIPAQFATPDQMNLLAVHVRVDMFSTLMGLAVGRQGFVERALRSIATHDGPGVVVLNRDPRPGLVGRAGRGLSIARGPDARHCPRLRRQRAIPSRSRCPGDDPHMQQPVRAAGFGNGPAVIGQVTLAARHMDAAGQLSRGVKEREGAQCIQ